jgi:chromosome partitioning protein
MSTTITLSNHKGGVGKTTSTINLGSALARLGEKVLLVDLDPQAHLTLSLGVRNPEQTIYGAIRKEYPLPLLQISERLHLVPSTLDLSGAEVELAAETGREYILRELLEPVKARFDYVLIDSPPSLGLLTLNALTASDEVLIPVQAEFLAVQGLTKLSEVITKIQTRLNKGLVVGGVLVTQYDGRKVLNRQVTDTIEQYFGGKVYKTRIRENVALAEAPTHGLDVFTYAPKSNGAEDYLAVAEEMRKNRRTR